jgi:hypothetical protein
MWKLTKILPVGAELFHAGEQTDRQTDRHDEADSRSSQFCECAENWCYGLSHVAARSGFCLAQVMTFYLACLFSHLAATSHIQYRSNATVFTVAYSVNCKCTLSCNLRLILFCNSRGADLWTTNKQIALWWLYIVNKNILLFAVNMKIMAELTQCSVVEVSRRFRWSADRSCKNPPNS